MIEYPQYYDNLSVYYKLIHYSYKREVMVIDKEDRNGCIRMLKAHNVQHWQYINNKQLFIFSNYRRFNYYYSLARYKQGIPNQPSSLKGRDNSQWNKEHHQHMEAYDFLLDIDAPERKYLHYAYESLQQITQLLNAYRIPYKVRFSGKGFHIIIPYEVFNHYGWSFNPFCDENIYQKYAMIAKKLFNTYSEFIDVGIYDSRRVVKMPYTIVNDPQESPVMCVPIMDFKGFVLKEFLCDNTNPVQVFANVDLTYNLSGVCYIDRFLKDLEVLKNGK